MTTLTKTFSAEITKIKHTATPWLVLAGAAFIPLLLLVMFLNNPAKVIVNTGENPWNVLLRSCFQFGSVFVIPLAVVLSTSLIINIEYKSNTWKHILVLPVSKDMIFLNKLLVIMLNIFALYCLFIFFLFLDAFIFKMQLKQYANPRYPFNWEYLMRLTFQSLVSVLPIIAIQLWLGLRIKNVIVVISIGLLCLIISIILSSPGTWSNVIYFPFAYPAVMSYRLNPLLHYKDLPYSMYALLFFMAIAVLCYTDYKRNFRG